MKHTKIWILTFLFLLAAMPVHAELTDDITAYYPFDANPEDVAGDNDGTIEGDGVTLTTGNGGKIGEAYSFDDDDGYIYVPYGTGTSYSYSLWIKLSSVGTVHYITSGQINQYSANLAVSSSGKVGMTVGSGDSWNFDGDTTLVADQWYHIGATFNGTIKKIYIDGELENSNEAVGSIDTDTANNIGRRSDGEGYFRGIIDEVGVWDRELSEYEITRLYNSGNGIKYPFSLYFTILGNINDFSAIVDDTVYNSSNGTITTDILYNSTQLRNITVSPNDYALNQTYTDYNVSTNIHIDFPQLNITAYDVIAATEINDFNATIQNRELNYEQTFTTADGLISEYLVNGTYTIAMNAPGFATINRTIELTGDHVEDFSLPYSNSINISIYDQSDGDLLTQNTTVRFTNDAGQFENTTTDGTLFAHNLTAGMWTIDFIVENYTVTSYPATVTDRSYQTLNAYVLPDSDSTTIFTVKNKDSGQVLEGATVSVYRIIDSTWTLINTLNSDVSGRVEFTYEDKEKYRFTTTKSGYSSKTFELNPILFPSYNILLQQNATTDDDSAYLGANIEVSPTLYYNDQTQNISVTIASTSGNLVRYGFNATYETTTVSATGSNLYGEALQEEITITGATTGDHIRVEYYYTTSGGETHSFRRTYDITGSRGLFGSALANEGNPYGLPLIDRIIIMSIVVVIIAGITYLFGGLPLSGTAAIFTLGYFAYISMVPSWAVLISVISLFGLIAWRSSI